MPGGLSPDAYLERRLRPLDAEHFSAAGMMPYRRTGKTIEVLAPHEKPWNSTTQGYDPLAWNVFGGKRIPRQEKTAAATALRNFLETISGVKVSPDPGQLKEALNKSFVLWYPLGKFALLMVDVSEIDSFSSLPEDFQEFKNAEGEFTESYVNELGIKKWRKNITELSWLPGTKVVEDKDVSDLLANCTKLLSFVEFLKGEFDADAALPKAPADDQFAAAATNGFNGHGQFGGKKGGKGGKNGKGGGKGGYNGKGGGWSMQQPPWAKGGCNGGGGNMMGMGIAMPQQYMMGGGGGCAPQPQMAFDSGQGADMQRQIYGEQLYLMVQPMAPSPYIAQKITGMLLELPGNELMQNLTDGQELQRRVTEAIEVLKEDGLIQ